MGRPAFASGAVRASGNIRKSSKKRRHSPPTSVAIFSSTLCLFAARAWAGDPYWWTSSTNGNWSNAANWNNLPTVEADLTLEDNVVVNFDYKYDASSDTSTSSTVTLSSVYLGAQGDTLSQSSAGTVMAAGQEFICGTNVVYDQTAGTNSVGTLLDIGDNAGICSGLGLYLLSGGNLTLASPTQSQAGPTSQVIGNTMSGGIEQTGGNNTLGSSSGYSFNNPPSFANLVIAQNASNSGTVYGNYTLNDSSASSSLTVFGNEYVGQGLGTGTYSAVGTFTQSGINVTHDIVGELSIGDQALGTGTFTLSGGSLTAGSEMVGNLGIGSLIQSGGTNSATTVSIAAGAGSTGTYNLSGGTLTLDLTAYVGGSGQGSGGNGTLTVSNTGQMTVGYHFDLYTNGAVSAVNESVAGAAAANGSIAVGPEGSSGSSGATLTQSGGTNTISATLSIGTGYTDTGYYTLSAGSLSANIEILGQANPPQADLAGTGTFVQTGGIHTVNSSFANYAGSSYSLSGGVLNLPTAIEAAANYSLFTLAGTGTLKGYLYNAASITDSNNVPISGFIITGGTVDAAATVENNGQIAIEGGTFNGTLLNDNSGLLTQTAGNLSATSTVQNNGQVAIENGTFAGTLFNNISGSVFQSGGTFTGALSSAGSVTLGGGTFSGTALSGSAQNLINGQFSLETGGTISVPTFINQGSFVYTGGTFTGKLVNQGSATLYGPGLALSNGVENDGTMDIGTLNFATAVTLGGAGLDNDGTLEVGNTTLNGSVINDYSGTLTNFFNLPNTTINGSLSNLGLFQPVAGFLNVTGTTTSSGTVLLNPGSTLNAAGGLTNTGTITIQGGRITGGAIVNGPGGQFNFLQSSGSPAIYGFSQSFSNAGGVVVVDTGQTVTFASFTSGNTAGGDIQIQSGATLTSGTAFPNSGTMELQGSTAALNGGAITNTGSITGLGRISNPVLNSGVVEVTGGLLTLSGAGSTNTAGGQIIIDSGSTIEFSQGLSASAGTITNNGGTFNNNSNALSNTGIINGYGNFYTGGTGLTSTGAITLTNGTSNVYGPLTNNSAGTVLVENGSVLFNNPVTNNGSFRVISGGTATFAGGFSGGSVSNTAVFINAGTLVVGGNFNNSGTATIGGTQSWSAADIFSNTAGTATFSTDAGSVTSSPLTISDTGGLVTFSSTQHLDALTISTGAIATASPSTPRNVIVTSSLSVTGSLDLTNNDMIVHNGTIGTISTPGSITAEIANGRNGATLWTGTGITSSTAAASPTLTALGILTGAQYLALHPGAQFDSQPVYSTDVLVKYTFVGDADLSGTITAADYALIDNGFNMGLTGWSNGDFNYDNVINGDDYSLIDNSFNTEGNTNMNAIIGTPADPADMIATGTAQIATSVPEPGTLTLLSLTGLVSMRRKRKSKDNSSSHKQ